MVLPSLADVLIVIVFLIPGFISFALVRIIGKYGKQLSEFEITIWSFVFSAIIIFTYTLVTKLNDLDAIRAQFFYPYNFSILFGLTGIIGIVAGLLFKITRKTKTIENSWGYTMNLYEKIYNDKNEREKLTVKIETKEKQEYHGVLFHASENAEDGIIIKEPSKLVYDNNNPKYVPLGKAMFINGNEISKIIFEGDIFSSEK